MKKKAIHHIFSAMRLADFFLCQGKASISEQAKQDIKNELKSPELEGFLSIDFLSIETKTFPNGKIIRAADKMMGIFQRLASIEHSEAGEYVTERINLILQKGFFHTVSAKFEMDDMTKIPAFIFNEWLTYKGGCMLADIINSSFRFNGPQKDILQQFNKYKKTAKIGRPFRERQELLKEIAELIRSDNVRKMQFESDNCSDELMKIAKSMYPSVPVRRFSNPR